MENEWKKKNELKKIWNLSPEKAGEDNIERIKRERRKQGILRKSGKARILSPKKKLERIIQEARIFKYVKKRPNRLKTYY